MKRVIAGRVYNTETADEICTDSRCHGDFSDHDTTLYRTKNGNFFLSGSGGPMSLWSQSCGQNSWTGGRGLIAIDTAEAQRFAERCDLDSDDMIAAGFAVTDA
jgi:hypothetical protein